MSSIPIPQPISEADYLAGELVAERKHEYVDGRVYAMAGGRTNHNAIATNILRAIASQLNGKQCQPLNSDMKIRVERKGRLRFYYPDASIDCARMTAIHPIKSAPL